MVSPFRSSTKGGSVHPQKILWGRIKVLAMIVDLFKKNEKTPRYWLVWAHWI